MEEEQSAGYRTVKKCAALLQTALKGLENKMVYFLEEKGFITEDVCSQVLSVGMLGVTSRTLMLVEGIKDRVSLDEDSYHELVRGLTLRGVHYAPIVKKLNEEYRRQTSGSTQQQDSTPPQPPPQQQAAPSQPPPQQQATPSQRAATMTSDDQMKDTSSVGPGRVQGDGRGSEKLTVQRHSQLSKTNASDIELKFGRVTPQPSREKKFGLRGPYPMENWPHGMAVVINNEKFGVHLDREGTKVDGDNLVKTLQYLGYVVEVYNNCTAKGIREIIDKYSMKDHTNYDSFICCILSHGTLGQVYGTDDYMVPVDEITHRLNAENCKTLASKPKIFFMQCCQGSMADRSVRVRSDGDDDDTPEKPSQIQTQTGTIRVASDSDIKIPSSSDFYYSFATASGHKAWRDLDYGSWYVSELCKTLITYSKYASLDDMMDVVNAEVAKKYEYKGKRQATEVVKRTNRDIFFF